MRLLSDAAVIFFSSILSIKHQMFQYFTCNSVAFSQRYVSRNVGNTVGLSGGCPGICGIRRSSSVKKSLLFGHFPSTLPTVGGGAASSNISTTS